MMLRLVLFGMVAALGVSIPAQPSCDHLYGSAQAWATSLLAEWDRWEPADDGAGLRLVGTQNPIACEECRLARMQLAVNIQETPTERALAADLKGATKEREAKPVPADSKPETPPAATTVATAVDPISVDDALEFEIAYELSRKQDGLEPKATETAVPDSVSAAAETDATVADPEMGIWCELYRAASAPVAATTGAEAAPAVHSQPPVSDHSFICGFGGIDLTAKVDMEGLPEPAEEVEKRAQNELS